MTQRILFRGKHATLGICKCHQKLLITDLDENDHFESYHEYPMCIEYENMIKEAGIIPSDLEAINSKELASIFNN